VPSTLSNEGIAIKLEEKFYISILSYFSYGILRVVADKEI
jgi:hypothetical protein